jgi:hypothetical protein
MNYFKIVSAASLAIVSVAYAAANPRADANGTCQFSPEDDAALARLVDEGGDSATLAEMLDGCTHLVYKEAHRGPLMKSLILARLEIFNLILPILSFPEAGQKNKLLSVLTFLAVSKARKGALKYLLSQDFTIDREVAHKIFWHAPTSNGAWSLAELKQLITEHPDKAADLSPRPADMYLVNSLEEASVLVELAHHCERLSHRRLFGPTEALRVVVFCTWLKHHPDQQAHIAIFLIQQEGAVLDQELLDLMKIDNPALLHLIDDWRSTADIKSPGTD